MPLTGRHEMADFYRYAAIIGRCPASAVDTPYSTDDCETDFAPLCSSDIRSSCDWRYRARFINTMSA